MNAVLDAAMALHATGCCVIPAAANGTKQPWPDGPQWKKYQAAQPDADQLRAWFAERYTGIGIVTGAVSGGLDMLEFEGRAVREGYFTEAQAIIEAAGLGDIWRRLTSGYMEVSPSGGIHFPYRIDGQPVGPNTKLAERPALDAEITQQERATIAERAAQGHDWRPRRTLMETRGEGGFTVTAPSHGSVHPTGKPWILASGGAATIPVLTAAEHRELQRVMRSLDQMPAPPAALPFRQPGRPQRDDDGDLKPGDDYAARTDWADILRPAGWTLTATLRDGTRDWRRPGKERGMSATTGRPPYDNLFVFSTSTEFDSQVPVSKFMAYAILRHGGDVSMAARALRLAGYGAPRAEATVTFAQPRQPVSVQQNAAETDTDAPAEWWTEIAARHQMVDWQQLFDDTPEHEEWLIEPLIAVGRSIAFYSPAKAGKSLLALEISCALVAGRPVLGQPAGPPRRVLYVDLENSRRDLKSRVTDLGYKPADLDGLAYLSFPSMPTLDSAEGGREIVALAIAHRIDLVIIDTVSRVISGKENDADTFNALYRHAIGPLKNLDIAVMRLDHAGKDLARGQRGSSSKNADVDSVWTLNVAGPVITLRCEMSRFQQDWPAISLRRHADPLRHEVTSSPVIGKAQALMATLDDLGVPRSATNRECLDALNQAAVGVNTNDLREAVRTRKLQMPLSQDHQTENADSADLRQNEAESGISAGQRLSQDHKTEKDSASHGAKVVSVSSGGPSIEGPAKTDADAQVRNRPDCCHRCGEIGGHSPGCEAAA